MKYTVLVDITLREYFMHAAAGETKDAKTAVPEWGTAKCAGYTDTRFGEKMRMECLGDDAQSEEWIVAIKVTNKRHSIPN